MTRETKIGLLVGLAFIIVIGILLSDHINTTTDPIRADARGIYDKVEQSVDAPESRKGSTEIVMPPQSVIPHNAVPVTPRSERHVDSNNVIDVSPGKDPSTTELPPRRPQGPVVVVAPADENPDVVTGVITNPTNGSVFTGQDTTVNNLVTEAQKKDEQIVSPNGNPVGISPAPVKPQITVVQSSGKQIKAEEGDNVSKLAGKYMGGNTRANREAIIKANPSMTPDGHLVFAGRTYIIPVPVAAPASAPVAIIPTPAPSKPAPVAAAPKPAASESGNYYTVKDNENLWKIAASQLGAGNRYTEIKELNADVLKGGDQVRTGMRLKLPNKSVASTN
jgi:nucleoid-associated protein YgaU